ncbi:hypothetical protein Tco_0625388 [Tanacetum coccineum]|uniref:Uncharacterized protein n=1 Tax=Tanacetum coccineum TaxID=301880 RepID=A0ABQ4WGN2_9ASTR
MLKNFDRKDLEVLWKIVKARFKKTEPVNYMDTFLHLNLKTMFEHHVEDSIWKNQQGLVKVLNWKLFYFCRVHCVTVQTIPYYLLVEKIFLDWSRNSLRKAMYLNKVFGSILLVKIKLLIKKLEDSEDEHQVLGRIVRIKRLLSAVEVTAASYDFYCCWIDSFVPMDSEVVKGSKDRAEGSETRAEGSSKRAGDDLQQESTKKQNMDDDKEKKELKEYFEIVPDDGDDVTIDATPLSVKNPIVDYKIYQEGKKSFFQIIRADGKT